jgi:hypothetical protein
MPFTQYPATQAFRPIRYAKDLLVNEGFLPPHWEIELGIHRLFYVRGFTEYSTKVTNRVATLVEYIPEMKNHLERLTGWGHTQFDWKSPFSAKQVSSVAHKEPLSFDKAAQAILLFGVAAAERAPAGIDKRGAALDATRNMTIQPAAFFIHGFDEGFVDLLKTRDPQLVNLTRALGQKRNSVFQDMAVNKRVTYELCNDLKRYIAKQYPEFYLGEIDASKTLRPSASEHENIDRPLLVD